MTAHHCIKTDGILQRARGMLNISAVHDSDKKSRLKDLRQQGSYRAIFPRPTQGTLEAVIINTAGGITGGDEFATQITANDHAKMSVTTQAAERIYKTPDLTLSSMHARLCAKPNAQLYWLPQETILFEGFPTLQAFGGRSRRGLKVFDGRTIDFWKGSLWRELLSRVTLMIVFA
jgi:urease accessory protein